MLYEYHVSESKKITIMRLANMAASIHEDMRKKFMLAASLIVGASAQGDKFADLIDADAMAVLQAVPDESLVLRVLSE